MKTKIILILLIVPILGFGQTKSTIDLVFGTEYSYRFINSVTDKSYDNYYINSRQGETGKINYRIGANYNLRLGDKFWFKTGMRLANIGYQDVQNNRHRNSICLQNGLLPSIQYFPKKVTEVVYDYYFLEMPVIIRFEFNTKRISPFLEMGVSPNIYLVSKTKTVSDFGVESEYYFENFSFVNFSGSISFGVNAKVNNFFTVFFQPVYRYHFTKLVYYHTKDAKENLYNYGIEMGLRTKIY